MRHDYRPGALRRIRTLLRLAALVSLTAPGVIGGCDALNPAFVDIVLPEDYQGPVVTENAKGHIPIFFVTNARFEGELLSYLDSLGVDITDPNLRPRVRIIADVAFTDGSSRVMEFVDGSTITQTVDAIGAAPGVPPTVAVIPPDLVSPPLTNQVVQCDVAAVAIRPQSIEVYVPVFMHEYSYVTTAAAGNDVLTRELSATYPPQFWQLEVDEVDEFLNATIIRNFGIRDVPGPIQDLTCGSVVMFSLEGALQVPFIGGIPGWLDEDTPTIEAFPGRYRMVTSVR